MPEQAPTLRELVQEVLNSGVTYRQLEERAVDDQSGKRASRSIFFDIASGKLDRMPYEHHLRAIAAGLRAPYESVRRAAIAQWLPGTDPEVPAFIDLRDWASWSQDDRDLVQLAVRTANTRARERQRAEHDPGNAA